MRRWTMVALIVMLFASNASAQTSGISEESLRALQRAVVNIAIKNHAVENLIYDGMTIQDVESVLDEEVSINRQRIPEIGYGYASSHGNYIVVWSELFRSDNPVVIGFMRRGETSIRHNYVDTVR